MLHTTSKQDMNMMKLLADWLTIVFYANGRIENLMKFVILAEKDLHLPCNFLSLSLSLPLI
jgi:hypothetical protein